MSDPYGSIQPYDDPYLGPAPLQEFTPEKKNSNKKVSFEFQSIFQKAKENPMLAVLISVIIIGFLLFGVLLLQATTQNTNNTTTTGNNNSGNNSTSSKKILLQFWGMYLDKEVILPLVEEYKSLNPNVSIDFADKTLNTPSDQGELAYRSELNSAFLSKDPAQQPDIFMVGNTWAEDYSQVAKVSDLYNLNTFSETFYPSAVSDLTFSGQVYGLPLWNDSLAIVYNKGILSSSARTVPPTEWSEFKNLAVSLNKGEISGFASGVAKNTEFSSELFWLLLEQNGVPLTLNGNLNIASNPSTVETLRYLQSFNGSTWKKSSDNSSVEFLKGRVAMITVPSWRLREILNQNATNNFGIDIGIAQLPQVQGQAEPLYNIAMYWALMVNKQRPNSSEAWKFIKWLTESTQLRSISTSVKEKDGYFGIVYPRKDMSELLKGDSYLDVYNKSASVANSFSMVKGLEVEALIEELVDGGSASQSEVTRVQSEINKLIAQKGILSNTFLVNTE